MQQRRFASVSCAIAFQNTRLTTFHAYLIVIAWVMRFFFIHSVLLNETDNLSAKGSSWSIKASNVYHAAREWRRLSSALGMDWELFVCVSRSLHVMCSLVRLALAEKFKQKKRLRLRVGFSWRAHARQKRSSLAIIRLILKAHSSRNTWEINNFAELLTVDVTLIAPAFQSPYHGCWLERLRWLFHECW